VKLLTHERSSCIPLCMGSSRRTGRHARGRRRATATLTRFADEPRSVHAVKSDADASAKYCISRNSEGQEASAVTRAAAGPHTSSINNNSVDTRQMHCRRHLRRRFPCTTPAYIHRGTENNRLTLRVRR